MLRREVTILNKSGLHARPAATFVREAQRHACEIRVAKGERVADAKSILGVLSLGVGQGDTVRLEVDGPGEKEALAALVKLVEDRLGEE